MVGGVGGLIKNSLRWRGFYSENVSSAGVGFLQRFYDFLDRSQPIFVVFYGRKGVFRVEKKISLARRSF